MSVATQRVTAWAGIGSVVAGAATVVGISPSGAAVASIVRSAPEGAQAVAPGQREYAGYDFTTVSGATTAVQDASVTFSIACADGSRPHPATAQVRIPDQVYNDSSATSGGWTPSADAQASSVFQGSVVMPAACTSSSNHTMLVGGRGQSTGPLVAAFSSSKVKRLAVRYHIGIPGAGSAGGGTWRTAPSVVPAPLVGVATVSAAGRWAPGVLFLVFGGAAGALGARLRRQPARV